MRAIRERPVPDDAAEDRRPIQFLTERGFTIIRRCDVDGSDPANGAKHCFVVKDVDGYELEITVTFDARAVQDLIIRRHGHLSPSSSFWIAAAERHLAEYLDRNGDFPPNAALNISQPNLDDIDSALRWSADEPRGAANG